MRFVLSVSLLVTALVARAGEPHPPGMAPLAFHESLTKAVGIEVRNAEWEYPKGMVPGEIPGLTYVSGPEDKGLAPKAAWRKPLLYRTADGSEVAVNVYRLRMLQPELPAKPGTPAAPLTEPDYRYEATGFHGGKAATAALKDRASFAFVDQGFLFKVEANGRKPEALPALAKSTAEAIWTFRQKK